MGTQGGAFRSSAVIRPILRAVVLGRRANRRLALANPRDHETKSLQMSRF